VRWDLITWASYFENFPKFSPPQKNPNVSEEETLSPFGPFGTTHKVLELSIAQICRTCRDSLLDNVSTNFIPANLPNLLLGRRVWCLNSEPGGKN
jgi:hypothetical protein